MTNKYFVSVLTLGLAMTPQQATAATGSAQLQQIITDICIGNINPLPGWDMVTIGNMCRAIQGGAGAGSVGLSANLGTANAGSGISSRKKKGIHDLQDVQKEKPGKGASADGGGWGLLVTPQYGKSNRTETDLENGYKSELAGLVVGLDYRFSDSFVLGGAIGQTKDNAAFLNGAGSLKTSNNTFTLYSTWIPSEDTSVDGYLGYGKINFDSQRYVSFDYGTGIFGTTAGATTGKQLMAGLSASHQTDLGRYNLSPSVGFDYIKTSINGYRESGTTTLEMRYGERSVTSLSSNLGVGVSTSFGYDWGTLLPSARLAAVHEFQNSSQQISNELASAPGTGFLVSTDSPDRNYLNLGLGVVAALDSGAQLFLDYEKRTQDKLLNSWAVSLGALVEF